MKRLEIKNAAYGVAFATVTQNLVAVDAAVSAKAGELQLTDVQYQTFRADVLNFRSMLMPAYIADQNQAALAKPVPAAAPKPVQAPAPAAAPIAPAAPPIVPKA